MTKKTLTGLGSYTWIYDSQGKAIYSKDTVNSQKTYFKYDDQGRSVGEKVYSTVNSNAYANFLYSDINVLDDEGRVIKNTTTANGLSVSTPYTYSEDGLTSTSEMTNIRIVTTNYNEDGLVANRSISTDTPVAETFSYTDDHAVATHTVNNDAYSYTYDDNGNITEVKKNNVLKQSYVYDSKNQLVRENNLDTNKTTTYTYDNSGNITSKSEYAYTTGALGAATSIKNYTYDTVWKDKLVSYNGENISYDAIGNPTTYRGATATWFGRQIQSYTKGSTSVTYKYDENGLRTSKTVNGVQYDYYYVGNKLMYEKKGNEYELFYRYDADGRLAMVEKRILSTGLKYYLYIVTNSRGDVLEIRNGSGETAARFTYDAWGKVISIKDANGNTLSESSFAGLISVRYRGYVYDSETGLYYLQSRYYDPDTGRFLNADDVKYIGIRNTVISYNLFAYCENNSINDWDEDGLISLKSVKEFFSNVISTIAQKLKDYFNNLIYIKNDVLSISTTVIEITLNTIISSFCAGKIVNLSAKVFSYILNRYKNNAPQKVVDIFTFIIKQMQETGLIRTIAKFIAKKLVVKKKIVKDSAISIIAKDFISGILLSNSELLSKVNTICSAMSSIGGALALLISGFDKDWFDGYLRINIISFRRKFL